ncbi:SDR family NAD(P)-dependent oxidoreductase [Mycobacterium avium]|jgi:NAD(P)-dependent dehydrogenase (short-subunit alcohol dehydrogenase family)|uniref:Short-chain dehydrogenase/reductase n=2 Tax=Mycobacterium avium TaxID=1764 RepID=A0A088DHM0_MYCAV|nr:SDR family NAD(P)-dependent oxidoreductase [Mycobacterium avium]AIL92354.1 short-chain dehydrogenase/reductase [Mycobacterium avium subsp. hominissuis]KBR64808.1 hypothetical protein X425_01444 [Mycobacterium avium XTB13-223]
MERLQGRLEGRPVLVTGAASGIGRATCWRLAAEGARVAALDVDRGGVGALADELRAGGADVFDAAVDVTCESEVEDATAAAVDRLGGLRGVVTCAGILPDEDQVPINKADLDVFTRVLTVNLIGTFLVLKHTMASLARVGGSVVTFSSIAALRQGGGVGYAASKGGVISLTRAIAAQWGRKGVRANILCPGGVETPMTGGIFSQPGVLEHLRRSTPLGRVAAPQEIAATVAFLLSDDSSYISGTTLPIDGGGSIA